LHVKRTEITLIRTIDFFEPADVARHSRMALPVKIKKEAILEISQSS
jgi:hypothetical protein